MPKPFRRPSLWLLVAGLIGTAAAGLGRTDTDPPPLDDATDPPAVGSLTIPSFVPPMNPPLPEIKLAAHVEPVGKGETPAVSLEWATPTLVKVREKGDYTLTVRNVSAQVLQKVVVQVRVPKHATVEKTTPAAKTVEGVYLWELGTLDPKATKPLTLSLTTATRGDLGCQAWVTFTGTTGMTVAVKEPKLAVEIVVPKEMPFREVFGVKVRVRNVGDCRVDDIVVLPALASGDPIRSAEPPQTYAVTPARQHPSLQPGESFDCDWTDCAQDVRGHEYSVSAAGSGGVKATGTAKVKVLVPSLSAQVTGPADVTVGRKARYEVTVTNTGDLPLQDIVAEASVPTGFRLYDATTGKGDSGRKAVRKTGIKLDPGQKHEFSYDLFAVAPGSIQHTVAVTGSRDTTASGNLVTRIDGIPALRMEMVDSVDPVEKGGQTTYEIRLTNTGSKADADLRLTLDLPKEFELVSATGPTDGLQRLGVDFTAVGAKKMNTVGFEPVHELAPQTEAVFRVTVKAVGTGDARFKATLTSKHLTTPVVKEESTRVYGD
jgi:uncharacterized repeat protein (TIGR01451 family)